MHEELTKEQEELLSALLKHATVGQMRTIEEEVAFCRMLSDPDLD